MKSQSLALFLITIFLASGTAAGAECKYKKKESDPFTEELTMVLTKWKTFRPTGNQTVDHGWMAGLWEDGKRFLALRIGLVGYPGRPTVPQGGRLMVLMADESVVELAAFEQVQITGWDAIVKFELDDETLDLLTAQGTTDIRLSTFNDEHDFSFGRKPTTRMQFVLNCIRALPDGG